MRLQLSTWPEVEAYLEQSRGIIVPIGSTEQHGPTGLIGTDAICAEAVAEGIGAKLSALVGPTISVGMSQHHMEFAGSMTLRPSTLIAVICDYVMSLAEHGFERFFLVNGHGGNTASIGAAFAEIHMMARGRWAGAAPDLRMNAVSWWESEGAARLSDELFGDRSGGHATPAEVSVAQHVHPDHIKQALLDPALAPGSAVGFFDARDYRRRFPDGRIGSDPGLARPQLGEQLLAAAVSDLAAKYSQFAEAD